MNERIDKIAGQGGTEEISRRVFLNWTGSTALLASTGLLTKVGRAYPAGAGKVIRMGVVGGGFGAHFHWHQHPNCKVTGVTDLRPERRDTLRKNYLCDAVYDSLEEMIKKAKDIDAVAIFSGAPDHAKHVKMCMERGWHVVSACPACMSVQEAEMMKEVKGKTGLKYMMAESSWYRQPTIYARNMYKAGDFGELIYSESEYYHNFANMHTTPDNKGTLFRMPDGKRTWRWGLPPMHYPTHSLGFLTGVTGERIIKVSCLGYGNPDSPVLKDNRYNNPFWNEAAMMKTNKGNMCRCNVFWKVRSGGERAQWIGSKGALYMALYQVHGNAKLPPDGKGGPVQIPEYWKTSEMLPDSMRLASGHGGSAVFISAEFINALLEEREPEIDLYESLAMTVPGIIAHQSALKDGEQLKVPNFDRKT